MPAFQPLTATVAQQQDYAECVGLLHPTDDMPYAAVLGLKLWIVAGFIGMVVGGWNESRNADIEIADIAMGTLLGVAVVGGVGIALLAVFAAVTFVIMG